MRHGQLVRIGVIAVLVAVPVMVGAQEPQPLPAKDSAWSVALRFGGFSDNDSRSWFGGHGKFHFYNPEPEVSGGIDISRLFGGRSAVTLSLEGLTFAGDAVVMAPITLTYKYFPIGNGLDPGPGGKPPAVQPWVGGGGGVYTFILDDESITRNRVGAQLSTGLLIPLGHHVEALAELRYAAVSDTRILSYTMGFGYRF